MNEWTWAPLGVTIPMMLLPDLNGSKARVIEESGGYYSNDVVARSYSLPLPSTCLPTVGLYHLSLSLPMVKNLHLFLALLSF